jgi:hypothetical protein
MPPLQLEPVLDQAGEIGDFSAHGTTFDVDGGNGQPEAG